MPKRLQTNLGEKTKLEFPRRGAVDDEVINSLMDLVTHRAALRIREASVCLTIRSPAAIMGNKPQKNKHLAGAQDFQIFSNA
jgi:hypothetical protein